ncbi:leucine-rich repeat-containing protein 19-like [Sardina pilchardus]|uniref:leucine-rich repeat-containing protein 19-like n=1 Tax=Sardina pilchardus TaxID=27697 RepID=UPI002E150C6B
MGHVYQANSLAWYLWLVLAGMLMSPEALSSDVNGESEYSVNLLQRKLLDEGNKPNTTTGPDKGSNSGTWPYLLAALITMLSVSLFVFVIVKCRLFQRYMASYGHMLLSDGDTISQCDPQGLDGFTPQSVAERVPPRRFHNTEGDDDDGFIEDNYIQAGERARAEREREQQRYAVEDSDDDELDLDQFTIG